MFSAVHSGHGRAVKICLLLTGALAFVPAAEAQIPLERFPVCEPSAVAPVSCGETGGVCLLVGDNEEEDDLYLYRIASQQRLLHPANDERFAVRLGKDIADIEAMARLGENEILVFGSHSRDRACGPEAKRRRFLHARFEDGALETTGEGHVKTKKIACKRLFKKSVRDDPAITVVCEAIDAAEQAADEIDDRRKETKDRDRAEEECEQAHAFNLEGAVAVEQDGRLRVWAGLRSPLVESAEGASKAVLMRMVDLDRFEFDAAALLDLGGRGVRELAESGEWIWGIAGPAQDSDAEFALWRFPKSELKPGAVIVPETVRALPTSSEGLAVHGGTLYIVIDGGRGDGECSRSPQFLTVRAH